ncbi:histidine kinase [Flavobacterium gawalongense]|uniref:Histidine kinase n=2 Tax=Flavobacterium gawalongense TaxID=2594432 RepID=A0A553BAM0_9FLAO|nr:histidine kinase [Flavobacterium gawalongense]TRW97934.1 histidine kinase [Flavobacterium gawalongense]TRX02298.1 histidine kinase [Flavobacterium gawalongense]TRX05294.1 histidine kinase [Flavobacterium gawalongense]TRX06167.1 histidine kinase [Flavobacterium gawalongense]TRX21877.1 histidine kinase [Flavobacterium gawalongense]
MSKIKEMKFDIKLQNHFWFWGLFFLMNFLRWGAYFNDYGYSLKSNILEFSLHIPLVYFNLYFLIPRYVLTSKYYKYSLALLLSLMVVYLLKTGLTYYIISEDIWPEANREYKPFELNHIVAVCIGEIYVLAIASTVYLTLIWLNERERNRAIKENQSKIELKYLKNQIQPHFFFNTLNNLYALSLESSDKVPDVIIKLSKLMEYVLYDIEGTKFVPLINEINYIQNYIEIEKLRFENVEVSINIDSNIDEIKVPPLLFISLVENAFKHGGINNDNLKIKINCKVINGTTLSFEILNNFVLSQHTKTKKGIGLINTKKRLKLIFKNKYTLEQKIKFNYYITRLQIPIHNED